MTPFSTVRNARDGRAIGSRDHAAGIEVGLCTRSITLRRFGDAATRQVTLVGED